MASTCGGGRTVRIHRCCWPNGAVARRRENRRRPPLAATAWPNGEDCRCRDTNAVAGCALHETRRLGVVARRSSAVAVGRGGETERRRGTSSSHAAAQRCLLTIGKRENAVVVALPSITFINSYRRDTATGTPRSTLAAG
nr:hypothetical protein Iba_scaffold50687CG0010 [Ipomoea batatas]